MSLCERQCYDGTANMAGSKKGVATQLASVEKRAIYRHCNGDPLKLAIPDAMKKNKILRNALYNGEISKLLKCSPRRDQCLRN